MQLYLIEILHQTTTVDTAIGWKRLLYLIEILHQTTTLPLCHPLPVRCILSKFYIKPQHFDFEKRVNYSCILSKFYIKPQRVTPDYLNYQVVSYRNSTSNHNSCLCISEETALYLIEILHQTTTCSTCAAPISGCILSKFYIKPQRSPRILSDRMRCILSKFYIKPQPYRKVKLPGWGCILSKFYIKPQHKPASSGSYELYLIEILHQTTTSGLILIDKVLLTGCLPL